jgi:hypothetical protein
VMWTMMMLVTSLALRLLRRRWRPNSDWLPLRTDIF